MNSYSDVDGVPAGADPWLLTDLLRDEWGFTGTVVSDYWAVLFLATMHRVAADTDEAGVLALTAGLDVELPDTCGFGPGLVERVRRGEVSETLIDRAARRLLTQKVELGLLDADWTPEALGGERGRRRPRLRGEPGNRPRAGRALGHPPRRRNGAAADATGPCGAPPDRCRRPLRGRSPYLHGLLRLPQPRAAAPPPPRARHRGADRGGGAARRSCQTSRSCTSRAARCRGEDRSGFAAATGAARDADVCVAFVGDRAGMFGQGTSGEGCDAEDLRLPGVQADLLDELVSTGTPVVVVVVSGRPYALGEVRDRAAGLVQAFMPGEEGGAAIAGVLSGRLQPSGKLPVQIPRLPGGQPGTYLQPLLGAEKGGISSLDPTPLFPFGHGVSYTTFEVDDLSISAGEMPTDGEFGVSVRVRNTGSRSRRRGRPAVSA